MAKKICPHCKAEMIRFSKKQGDKITYHYVCSNPMCDIERRRKELEQMTRRAA